MADDAARRVGRRRADRHRDRDPLGPRRELRRGGRAAARAPPRGCSRSPSALGIGARGDRAPIRGRTTSTSGSSTRRTTTGCARSSRWVAQRNNTWSLHVHVGVRGADRAIAVCDHLRGAAAAAARALRELAVPRRPGHRPALGAHRDLHAHVPALRGPRAVRRLGDLRRLRRPARRGPSSIVESTQLWWSVRPHHALRHGRGADLRRADARRRVVRRSPR